MRCKDRVYRFASDGGDLVLGEEFSVGLPPEVSQNDMKETNLYIIRFFFSKHVGENNLRAKQKEGS